MRHKSLRAVYLAHWSLLIGFKQTPNDAHNAYNLCLVNLAILESHNASYCEDVKMSLTPDEENELAESAYTLHLARN